ncbi:hypothetical protein WG66_016388 [Moniliophthora roreri]|nr:hypothetical protein WG66_016388 [Moniliophthora roreri]
MARLGPRPGLFLTAVYCAIIWEAKSDFRLVLGRVPPVQRSAVMTVCDPLGRNVELRDKIFPAVRAMVERNLVKELGLQR